MDRQVVFKESVETLSVTTKTKLVRVSGGFYSEEDMKKELEYSQCLASTYSMFPLCMLPRCTLLATEGQDR